MGFGGQETIFYFPLKDRNQSDDRAEENFQREEQHLSYYTLTYDCNCNEGKWEIRLLFH